MKAAIAIPVTLAMVYRAGSHKSLTPAGIVAAVITAAAHAIHPWNLPFALLIIFYLIGTRVTKVCSIPRTLICSPDQCRSNMMSRLD